MSGDRPDGPGGDRTTGMVTLAFSWIAERCSAEGLHAVAVLPVPASLDPTGMDRLLADGVGDMAYLDRTRDLRLAPGSLLAGARSLVVAALPYQTAAGAEELRRARYAAGRDYHGLFRTKLARVGAAICAEGGGATRALVDSAPLNERTLATQAGMGWIGRNALLISPHSGSFLLLGFLLSVPEIEPRSAGAGADRCGRCRACERACPTQALVDRRVVSERCISYLTIEHRGVIPRELARHFQGWWFGCDICQEVCPWNRFAPGAGDPRLTGEDADLVLLGVTSADFDRAFAGRAIRRIGYERFRRNLLVAAWSLGRTDWYAPIIAEGLPLIRAQSAELGCPGIAEGAS